MENYYSIIPANVRYDKRLTAQTKLLYAEISALCNKRGFCWARDDYFVELYSVSQRTIQRWLERLIETGHIYRNIRCGTNTKNALARCLSIVPYDNVEVVTNDDEVVTKMSQKGDKNVTPNDNNIINNIYKDKSVCLNNIIYNYMDTAKGGTDGRTDSYTVSKKELFLKESLTDKIESLKSVIDISDETSFQSVRRLDNIIAYLPDKIKVNGKNISHEDFLESIIDLFRCPSSEITDTLYRVFTKVDRKNPKNKQMYMLSALWNASKFDGGENESI